MIAAGQSIGNYRILSKIGTGGMGAVYLAEHPLIGKRVALKVIHRELAGNRDVVSRFFQEARAVNKLGNDHIVEIHDFGVTPEGDHFYIMEYLDGRTLASILGREKRLDVMRALHVGAQIANALAAAHAAGIIHRDLKPDNIMVMPRLGDPDFVKVLDFGLAKVFSAASAVKTAAGVLLGTPQYMSPEACESRGEVDHRTDIYALGVLLFQMMTGVLPFDGASMGEVLVKQVTALPPVPRALNPSIPPSVEQILLRCLAKRLDARFATMLQLREALLDPEAYLRGSPPIAPARSVGSGEGAVDAKTVMVQAGQLQATRVVGGSALPLPPPVLSIALAPASAPTVIADMAGVMGAGGPGGQDGPRGPGRPGPDDRRPFRRATTGMPELAPPQEPNQNTMRIATPVGYFSRPPRKVWPLVLVMALLLGLGGGALVVAVGGHRDAADGSGDPDVRIADEGSAAHVPSGPAAGSGGRAAGPVSATAGAGSAATVETAGSSAAAAAVRAPGTPIGVVTVVPRGRTAHLAIDSVPTGAEVSGPEGEALGTTPLKLEWPISDLPVTFELRLAGFKKKQKQTVVNSNTALHIELERAQPGRHGGVGGAPPRPGTSGSATSNGLMRPDD
ncbi:MAG TPA: serine/threonine-protein kinase [Kofleriaceae bacterium]|nr:serine/threonine-protein kinase [Kofleriaceae bacterium]